MFRELHFHYYWKIIYGILKRLQCFYKGWETLGKKVLNIYKFLIISNSFIDIPNESCGRSSPLRVCLQATAPDILLIFLRYGANPNANDGGTSPVEALLEKLKEYDESSSYPYQLVSCFKIFMLAIPFIELPYKVKSFKTLQLRLIYLIFILLSLFFSHLFLKQGRKCSWKSIRN